MIGKHRSDRSSSARLSGPTLRSDPRGFTFLAVMFSIVLIGTLIGVAARQLATVAKREKEAELLFRGQAIRRGIELYYRTSRAGFSQYPRALEDLIKDPGSPGVRRYLRKLYADPITGGEWVLIRDGSGRVKGVRSASEETPLKLAHFPEELKSFEQKNKYSEWVFEYNPQQQPPPISPHRNRRRLPRPRLLNLPPRSLRPIPLRRFDLTRIIVIAEVNLVFGLIFMARRGRS